MTDRGWATLAAVRDVAERRGATPGQVAIAWLLRRPSITAPIAGASIASQIDDLVRATEIELDEKDLAWLDAASAPSAIWFRVRRTPP